MTNTNTVVDTSAEAVEAVARDMDRHNAIYQIGENVTSVSALLRALLAERPQWRDIADAPKNMPVWVGAETKYGFKQACATFLLTVQRWYYEDGHTPLPFWPTVFMDLPAPPVSRQQDGET